MKKRFLLISLFLFSFLMLNSRAEITGHATQLPTNVTIVVSSAYPIITITYPLATTYEETITSLNYTVSHSGTLDTCKYSINNGVTNTTILCGTNVTGLTSSEGSNTWRVFTNDTLGLENSTSVTFIVDSSGEEDLRGGGGSSGGGGGGGGAPALTQRFSVSSEELNIKIISEQESTSTVKVKNTGTTTLKISLKISGVESFTKIGATELTLAPGEEKEVLIFFTAPKEGVYAGKLILQSGMLTEEVLLLVNVQSERSLFDVSITLPEKFQTIIPGENLRAFVSLVDVGELSEVDVTIKYSIKDFDGNVLLTESEAFFVPRSKNFVKEFRTSELPPGDYVVSMEVTYPDGFASSSAHFSIIDRRFNTQFIIVISVSLLAVLAIVLSVWFYKKPKKKR